MDIDIESSEDYVKVWNLQVLKLLNDNHHKVHYGLTKILSHYNSKYPGDPLIYNELLLNE